MRALAHFSVSIYTSTGVIFMAPARVILISPKGGSPACPKGSITRAFSTVHSDLNHDGAFALLVLLVSTNQDQNLECALFHLYVGFSVIIFRLQAVDAMITSLTLRWIGHFREQLATYQRLESFLTSRTFLGHGLIA